MANKGMNAMKAGNDDRQNRRGQFGLMTILLLIACFSTWFAYYQTRTSHQQLLSQLPSLRKAACVLRVEEPSQFAVVRQDDPAYRDELWKVYFPPNHRYVAKVLFDDCKIIESPTGSFPITPGIHDVKIRIDYLNDVDNSDVPHEEQLLHQKIEVFVDGEKQYEKTRFRKRATPMFSAVGDKHLYQQETSEAIVLVDEKIPVNSNWKPPAPIGPQIPLTMVWIEMVAHEPDE